MDRRHFLFTALGVSAGTLLTTREIIAQQGAAKSASTLPPMTVYKSASCGCCTDWVNHARKGGFTVRVVDTEDLAGVKREMGIPATLQSCHTVMVGTYVVEGHVPAEDIKKLLATKPKIRGLAVPGMPVGSPGMEQGPAANYDRYEVLAFTAAGTTSVFATHGPPRRG